MINGPSKICCWTPFLPCPSDMVSRKLKHVSDSDDSININKSPTMENGSQIGRTCVDCNTTKTPLWRGGPAGPRSLCNACGIRHRKSKRALLTSNERSKDKKLKLKRKYISSRKDEKAMGLMRLMSIGGRMEKLREEEEAAILLMALSCGYGCTTAF